MFKPAPVVLAAALTVAVDVVSDHERFSRELEQDRSLSDELCNRVWKHIEDCGTPDGSARFTACHLTPEQCEKCHASGQKSSFSDR